MSNGGIGFTIGVLCALVAVLIIETFASANYAHKACTARGYTTGSFDYSDGLICETTVKEKLP